MVKKKLLTALLISTCILSVTGCKKANDEAETDVKHEYAINETKDKTEEETEEETTEFVDPGQFYTPDETTTEEYENPFNEEEDNSKYVYPTETDPGFYINFVKFAETARYGFKLDDIISNDSKTYAQISNENKVFCLPYGQYLRFTDADALTAEDGYISLGDYAKYIEYIKIDDKQYTLDKFLYPGNKFDDLITDLSKNYKVINNKVDITPEMSSKQLYEWTFEINDKNYYSADELKELTDKNVADSTLRIVGTYFNDELISYEVSVNKISRYWITEYMQPHTIYDFEFDDDGNMTSMTPKDTEYISTGRYTCGQDGFDFTNAHMKIKDGSYIGLFNVSFVVHNSDNTYNSKLTINYNNE